MLLYLSEPAGVLTWELGLGPVGGPGEVVPVKASCPPEVLVAQRHSITRSDVCELWQRCPGSGDSALKEAWKAIQQKARHPSRRTRGLPFLMLCFPGLLWARPRPPPPGGRRPGLAWVSREPFPQPASPPPSLEGLCPSRPHSPACPSQDLLLGRGAQILMPATYRLPGRPP